MTIKELQTAIDDIESQWRQVQDIAPRIDRTEGTYQVLRELGINTKSLRTNALALEYELGYQLQVMKDSLELYQKVENSVEMNGYLPAGWKQLTEDLYEDQDGRIHTDNPNDC